MVLSKRERYIALTTATVLALLLADRVLFTPLHKRRVALDEQTQTALSRLEYAGVIMDRRKQLASKWREMVEGGMKWSSAETESLVLHAVRDWSQEARLSLSSLRPERTERKEEGLEEITFRASGTGSMSAVANFLWRLESSALPVRVSELQLGTRKEGTDDLSLQLRISALCMADDEQSPALATANRTRSK